MTDENIEKKDQTGNQGDERYYGIGAFIFEVIKIVAFAFVIIAVVRIFLFQPFFVQGASMEPNFEDNQYLIVNELGYKENSFSLGSQNLFTVGPFKELSRQTVIVFRFPLDPTKFFIKRVIGLPGEKVQIKDGSVKIFNTQHPDGYTLDESAYLSRVVKTAGDQTVNLKPDEYFVMGDNRGYSSDSRAWGPVNQKFIVGTVLLRAWPLDKVTVY
jgi:signal peptidase I